MNILRNKEQLGYIVFSGIRRTNGVQGLRVIIQSSRHPEYVEKRIDEFMESMLVNTDVFYSRIYLQILF